MVNVSHHTFDAAYKGILGSAISFGRESSPRGQKIFELIGFSWSLSPVPLDPTIHFKTTQVPERQEVFELYKKAELEWYQSGCLDATSAPSKFWLKLANAEGMITSNYGYMILHAKKYGGLTAFEHAVKLLTEDRDSRQAVLHYSHPEHYQINPKDVPCTLCAQLLIRDNQLTMIVSQRSCDIIRGLSYDIPWHCWLMHKFATALNCQPAQLIHHVGSLHLYAKDIELARKILSISDQK